MMKKSEAQKALGIYQINSKRKTQSIKNPDHN